MYNIQKLSCTDIFILQYWSELIFFFILMILNEASSIQHMNGLEEYKAKTQG